MLSLDPGFITIKEGETDGEYRGRCVNAIQRWEKEYQRQPRKSIMELVDEWAALPPSGSNDAV